MISSFVFVCSLLFWFVTSEDIKISQESENYFITESSRALYFNTLWPIRRANPMIWPTLEDYVKGISIAKKRLKKEIYIKSNKRVFEKPWYLEATPRNNQPKITFGDEEFKISKFRSTDITTEPNMEKFFEQVKETLDEASREAKDEPVPDEFVNKLLKASRFLPADEDDRYSKDRIVKIDFGEENPDSPSVSDALDKKIKKVTTRKFTKTDFGDKNVYTKIVRTKVTDSDEIDNSNTVTPDSDDERNDYKSYIAHDGIIHTIVTANRENKYATTKLGDNMEENEEDSTTEEMTDNNDLDDIQSDTKSDITIKQFVPIDLKKKTHKIDKALKTYDSNSKSKVITNEKYKKITENDSNLSESDIISSRKFVPLVKPLSKKFETRIVNYPKHKAKGAPVKYSFQHAKYIDSENEVTTRKFIIQPKIKQQKERFKTPPISLLVDNPSTIKNETVFTNEENNGKQITDVNANKALDVGNLVVVNTKNGEPKAFKTEDKPITNNKWKPVVAPETEFIPISDMMFKNKGEVEVPVLPSPPEHIFDKNPEGSTAKGIEYSQTNNVTPRFFVIKNDHVSLKSKLDNILRGGVTESTQFTKGAYMKVSPKHFVVNDTHVNQKFKESDTTTKSHLKLNLTGVKLTNVITENPENEAIVYFIENIMDKNETTTPAAIMYVFDAEPGSDKKSNLRVGVTLEEPEKNVSSAKLNKQLLINKFKEPKEQFLDFLPIRTSWKHLPIVVEDATQINKNTNGQDIKVLQTYPPRTMLTNSKLTNKILNKNPAIVHHFDETKVGSKNKTNLTTEAKPKTNEQVMKMFDHVSKEFGYSHPDVIYGDDIDVSDPTSTLKPKYEAQITKTKSHPEDYKDIEEKIPSDHILTANEKPEVAVNSNWTAVYNSSQSRFEIKTRKPDTSNHRPDVTDLEDFQNINFEDSGDIEETTKWFQYNKDIPNLVSDGIVGNRSEKAGETTKIDKNETEYKGVTPRYFVHLPTKQVKTKVTEPYDEDTADFLEETILPDVNVAAPKGNYYTEATAKGFESKEPTKASNKDIASKKMQPKFKLVSDDGNREKSNFKSHYPDLVHDSRGIDIFSIEPNEAIINVNKYHKPSSKSEGNVIEKFARHRKVKTKQHHVTKEPVVGKYHKQSNLKVKGTTTKRSVVNKVKGHDSDTFRIVLPRIDFTENVDGGLHVKSKGDFSEIVTEKINKIKDKAEASDNQFNILRGNHPDTKFKLSFDISPSESEEDESKIQSNRDGIFVSSNAKSDSEGSDENKILRFNSHSDKNKENKDSSEENINQVNIDDDIVVSQESNKNNKIKSSFKTFPKHYKSDDDSSKEQVNYVNSDDDIAVSPIFKKTDKDTKILKSSTKNKHEKFDSKDLVNQVNTDDEVESPLSKETGKDTNFKFETSLAKNEHEMYDLKELTNQVNADDKIVSPIDIGKDTKSRFETSPTKNEHKKYNSKELINQVNIDDEIIASPISKQTGKDTKLRFETYPTKNKHKKYDSKELTNQVNADDEIVSPIDIGNDTKSRFETSPTKNKHKKYNSKELINQVNIDDEIISSPISKQTGKDTKLRFETYPTKNKHNKYDSKELTNQVNADDEIVSPIDIGKDTKSRFETSPTKNKHKKYDSRELTNQVNTEDEVVLSPNSREMDNDTKFELSFDISPTKNKYEKDHSKELTNQVNAHDEIALPISKHDSEDTDRDTKFNLSFETLPMQESSDEENLKDLINQVKSEDKVMSSLTSKNGLRSGGNKSKFEPYPIQHKSDNTEEVANESEDENFTVTPISNIKTTTSKVSEDDNFVVTPIPQPNKKQMKPILKQGKEMYSDDYSNEYPNANYPKKVATNEDEQKQNCTKKQSKTNDNYSDYDYSEEKGLESNIKELYDNYPGLTSAKHIAIESDLKRGKPEESSEETEDESDSYVKYHHYARPFNFQKLPKIPTYDIGKKYLIKPMSLTHKPKLYVVYKDAEPDKDKWKNRLYKNKGKQAIRTYNNALIHSNKTKKLTTINPKTYKLTTLNPHKLYITTSTKHPALKGQKAKPKTLTVTTTKTAKKQKFVTSKKLNPIKTGNNASHDSNVNKKDKKINQTLPLSTGKTKTKLRSKNVTTHITAIPNEKGKHLTQNKNATSIARINATTFIPTTISTTTKSTTTAKTTSMITKFVNKILENATSTVKDATKILPLSETQELPKLKLLEDFRPDPKNRVTIKVTEVDHMNVIPVNKITETISKKDSTFEGHESTTLNEFETQITKSVLESYLADAKLLPTKITLTSPMESHVTIPAATSQKNILLVNEVIEDLMPSSKGIFKEIALFNENKSKQQNFEERHHSTVPSVTVTTETNSLVYEVIENLVPNSEDIEKVEESILKNLEVDSDEKEHDHLKQEKIIPTDIKEMTAAYESNTATNELITEKYNATQKTLNETFKLNARKGHDGKWLKEHVNASNFINMGKAELNTSNIATTTEEVFNENVFIQQYPIKQRIPVYAKTEVTTPGQEVKNETGQIEKPKKVLSLSPILDRNLSVNMEKDLRQQTEKSKSLKSEILNEIKAELHPKTDQSLIDSIANKVMEKILAIQGAKSTQIPKVENRSTTKTTKLSETPKLTTNPKTEIPDNVYISGKPDVMLDKYYFATERVKMAKPVPKEGDMFDVTNNADADYKIFKVNTSKTTINKVFNNYLFKNVSYDELLAKYAKKLGPNFPILVDAILDVLSNNTVLINEMKIDKSQDWNPNRVREKLNRLIGTTVIKTTAPTVKHNLYDHSYIDEAEKKFIREEVNDRMSDIEGFSKNIFATFGTILRNESQAPHILHLQDADQANPADDSDDTFENEQLFTDRDIYDYEAKKHFVETLISVILDKGLSQHIAVTNKSHFKETQIDKMNSDFTSVVSEVLNKFLEKFQNRNSLTAKPFATTSRITYFSEDYAETSFQKETSKKGHDLYDEIEARVTIPTDMKPLKGEIHDKLPFFGKYDKENKNTWSSARKLKPTESEDIYRNKAIVIKEMFSKTSPALYNPAFYTKTDSTEVHERKTTLKIIETEKTTESENFITEIKDGKFYDTPVNEVFLEPSKKYTINYYKVTTIIPTTITVTSNKFKPESGFGDDDEDDDVARDMSVDKDVLKSFSSISANATKEEIDKINREETLFREQNVPKPEINEEYLLKQDHVIVLNPKTKSQSVKEYLLEEHTPKPDYKAIKEHLYKEQTPDNKYEINVEISRDEHNSEVIPMMDNHTNKEQMFIDIPKAESETEEQIFREEVKPLNDTARLEEIIISNLKLLNQPLHTNRSKTKLETTWTTEKYDIFLMARKIANDVSTKRTEETSTISYKKGEDSTRKVYLKVQSLADENKTDYRYLFNTKIPNVTQSKPKFNVNVTTPFIFSTDKMTTAQIVTKDTPEIIHKEMVTSVALSTAKVDIITSNINLTVKPIVVNETYVPTPIAPSRFLNILQSTPETEYEEPKIHSESDVPSTTPSIKSELDISAEDNLYFDEDSYDSDIHGVNKTTEEPDSNLQNVEDDKKMQDIDVLTNVFETFLRKTFGITGKADNLKTNLSVTKGPDENRITKYKDFINKIKPEKDFEFVTQKFLKATSTVKSKLKDVFLGEFYANFKSELNKTTTQVNMYETVNFEEVTPSSSKYFEKTLPAESILTTETTVIESTTEVAHKEATIIQTSTTEHTTEVSSSTTITSTEQSRSITTVEIPPDIEDDIIETTSVSTTEDNEYAEENEDDDDETEEIQSLSQKNSNIKIVTMENVVIPYIYENEAQSARKKMNNLYGNLHKPINLTSYIKISDDQQPDNAKLQIINLVPANIFDINSNNNNINTTDSYQLLVNQTFTNKTLTDVIYMKKTLFSNDTIEDIRILIDKIFQKKHDRLIFNNTDEGNVSRQDVETAINKLLNNSTVEVNPNKLVSNESGIKENTNEIKVSKTLIADNLTSNIFNNPSMREFMSKTKPLSSKAAILVMKVIKSLLKQKKFKTINDHKVDNQNKQVNVTKLDGKYDQMFVEYNKRYEVAKRVLIPSKATEEIETKQSRMLPDQHILAQYSPFYEPYENKDTDQKRLLHDACGIENSNNDNVEPRVETYPWFGVLLYPRGSQRFVTRVVLVSIEIVLGSALDIDKLPKKDFREKAKVVLGTNCTGPRLDVINYNYHPEFRTGFYNTIAIIQIESTAGFHNLRPLCAPPKKFSNNAMFYAMEVSDDCRSSKIKIHEIDFVPLESCKDYYEQPELFPPGSLPKQPLCARTKRGGDCVWRAGASVLVVRQGYRWYLLGFSVPGPGCEAPSRYIDYTRYSNWVAGAIERIGQPAVTRLAPNQLVLRRSINQIQRFGPCDRGEVSIEIFADTTDVKPPLDSNTDLGWAQYDLTISNAVNYECVLFHAYNIGDRRVAPPRIELKPYCRVPLAFCLSLSSYLPIDFYVTVYFYQPIKYKVLAFGKEINITEVKTKRRKRPIEATEPPKTTPKYTSPLFSKLRRYTGRKVLQKYKNPLRLKF